MILTCTADWHNRSNRPKNRIDNFKEALLGKIRWILDQIVSILLAGDVFDSPFAPYSLTLEIMKLLQDYNLYIFTVFGQHDLRYHTSKENTPLAILNQSGLTHNVGYNFNTKEGVAIYGSSFNEEIPKIVNRDCFNILLIHKMIVQDKLWAAQTGHAHARHLLMKSGFDLIVSGDNHQTFIEQYKDRFLINPGSLMRSRIDQKDHKPCIVLFDTEKRTAEIKYIPVKPIEEVMNLSGKDKTPEEENEHLKVLVKGLMEDKEMGLDFMVNFLRHCKENKIKPSIVELVKEAAKEET